MTFIRLLVLMFALGSISACGTFTTFNPPAAGEAGNDEGDPDGDGKPGTSF